jgi:hypothetical protein
VKARSVTFRPAHRPNYLNVPDTFFDAKGSDFHGFLIIVNNGYLGRRAQSIDSTFALLCSSKFRKAKGRAHTKSMASCYHIPLL